MSIFKNFSPKKIGDTLEKNIVAANEIYLSKNQANIRQAYENIDIYKKEKVHLGKNYSRIRVEGYLCGKSDLDFYGAVAGNYNISFDAKASKGTRFKLNNISENQIRKIQNNLSFGEITFVLYWNYEKDDYYIIPGDLILAKYNLYIENKAKNNGKCQRGYGNIDLANMKSFKMEYFLNYLKYV